MATISTRGTNPRLPTGDDEPVDDERQVSVPILLRLLFLLFLCWCGYSVLIVLPSSSITSALYYFRSLLLPLSMIGHACT